MYKLASFALLLIPSVNAQIHVAAPVVPLQTVVYQAMVGAWTGVLEGQ